MTVDLVGLVHHLQRESGAFGVLTQQSSPVAALLAREFGGRLQCLFSAEHGYFGLAAPGEKTLSAVHPIFNVPVHSLYGATRKPTPEMLKGLDRVVVDLQDVGVRCYTYLATLKLVLEAATERNVAVTVLDRPLPHGGHVDGPGRQADFESFVAPLDVPFCHGMTPGECAVFIRERERLDLDLTIMKMADWNHQCRDPWPNFMPPSPGLPNWDSAVLYPATVFTEAYPAVDCDRGGAFSFRVFGAPWLDAKWMLEKLAKRVHACGIGIRPYRYRPVNGPYATIPIDGVLLSAESPAYYPVTAGALVFEALVQRHHDELQENARPEWLHKLFGSKDLLSAAEHGAMGQLLQEWIAEQDAYRERKIDLYG